MNFDKIYRHGDVLIFRITGGSEPASPVAKEISELDAEYRHATGKEPHTFFEKLLASLGWKKHSDTGQEESVRQPAPLAGSIDKLLTGKRNSIVLELGEVTGHSHKLEGDVDVMESDEAQSTLTFRVNEKAVLTHEEHDPIVLDKGIYMKVTQVEYDPFNDLIVRIRD